MKIGIKDFPIKMDVGSRGIEFEVNDTKGKHLGDLIITRTTLIWCKGRKARANGKPLNWNKFITMMDQLPEARKVAARTASPATPDPRPAPQR